MTPLGPSQAEICLAILVARLGGDVVCTKEELEKLQTQGKDLYSKTNWRGDVMLTLKGSPIVIGHPSVLR